VIPELWWGEARGGELAGMPQPVCLLGCFPTAEISRLSRFLAATELTCGAVGQSTRRMLVSVSARE
jgi:hypothetical protein